MSVIFVVIIEPSWSYKNAVHQSFGYNRKRCPPSRSYRIFRAVFKGRGLRWTHTPVGGMLSSFVLICEKNLFNRATIFKSINNMFPACEWFSNMAPNKYRNTSGPMDLEIDRNEKL